MKTTKILLLSFFMVFGFSQTLHAIPINIKVIFPFFTPTQVEIMGGFSSWAQVPMQQLSDRTFEHQNFFEPGNHSINIRFKVPPYNSNNFYYAATSWEGFPRIIYTKIYINNQLISSVFVRSDSNINFTLLDNGIVTPIDSLDTGNPMYDDRIPPEVHYPKDTIKVENGVPGPNYTKLAGWVQVLHDNNFIEPSKIEVKSIKLYARVGTQDVLLDAADYSVTPFNPSEDGGLYFRYPFFVHPTDHDPMEPASVVNGLLTFNPSDHKDTVWHFWNPAESLVSTNQNYTSYWFEIIYRIIGQACVQIGIDFRDPTDNTFEGAVSNWRFETYGGQFDTLRVDTRRVVTSINEEGIGTNKDQAVLYESHPNPFNTVTLITYKISVREYVTFKLYDTSGQEVLLLFDREQDPGEYKLALNGSKFSSGIYYLKMTAGEYSKIQKLVLLK